MRASEKTCLTTGQIARILGQPAYRVAYILRTRQHIQPLARAGNVRVYTGNALAQVRYEINRIDAIAGTRKATAIGAEA